MEEFRKRSVATSTERVYGSAQERYKRYCRAAGRQPLPTSERTLCRFVALLATQGVSLTSIKCYLAAVRHWHIAEGWGDPHIGSMPKLEQVTKGIKSIQARALPSLGKPRRPISPMLLRKMRRVWLDDADSDDKEMLWAACTLCFFGFFRSEEIVIPTLGAFDQGTHLTFDDVTVDNLQNPRLLRVRLKESKTDPFRKGIDVFVGRTEDDLCPVAAVLKYMVKRKKGPGPFFRFCNGQPLTRPRLVIEVKRALTRAGVNSDHYSGHSFRSGAATAAAERGVEDATIKMLGRWKSSAYQLYVRTPREQLAAISKKLSGESKKRAAVASSEEARQN